MKKFYFTQEATLPVREEPREGAEMETQLIFGEICELLEEKENWWRIRSVTDNYEGWINPVMVLPIEENWNGTDWLFVLGGHVKLSDGSRMMLPAGAKIPVACLDGRTIRVGEESWEMDTDLKTIAVQNRSELIPLSRLFLNTSYLWGGRSSFGIDCSGLSQCVYRMCGINIPRDSSQQGKSGTEIPFEDRQIGDLAFFSKIGKTNITHVGILSSFDTIIHASGKVREDQFDTTGIVRSGSGKLTHQLVSIRRW